MGATTKSTVATPAAGAAEGAGVLRRLRAMLGCIDDALGEHERAARAGPTGGVPIPGDLSAAEESAKCLLVYLTGMDGRLPDQALEEMRD